MEYLHCKAKIPAKYRIINVFELFFGEKRIITTTITGFKVAVDTKDIIQRSILYSKMYEPELTKLIQQEITDKDNFYDIGANIGYYSLLALNKQAKVVAFDPDQANTDILKLNIEINFFSPEEVKIFTYALGEKTEELNFYRANVANTGISSLKKTEPNYSDSFKVKVFPLDFILENYALPPPSILKIDVEGWEYQVLNGARELFTKKPPRLVFFEADVDQYCQIEDEGIINFFKLYNYDLEWIARENGVIEAKENFSAKLNAK